MLPDKYDRKMKHLLSLDNKNLSVAEFRFAGAEIEHEPPMCRRWRLVDELSEINEFLIGQSPPAGIFPVLETCNTILIILKEAENLHDGIADCINKISGEHTSLWRIVENADNEFAGTRLHEEISLILKFIDIDHDEFDNDAAKHIELTLRDLPPSREKCVLLYNDECRTPLDEILNYVDNALSIYEEMEKKVPRLRFLQEAILKWKARGREQYLALTDKT